MTYYEYVKMTNPKYAHEDGFVGKCPPSHGLPAADCALGFFDGSSCIDCYAKHEVPEDMVRDLLMRPIPDEDLMKMIGGVV